MGGITKPPFLLLKSKNKAEPVLKKMLSLALEIIIKIKFISANNSNQLLIGAPPVTPYICPVV